MPPILLVALGSAAGGVARWAVAGWLDARFGPTYSWGTLAVNLLGGLCIGLVAAMNDREAVRLLLVVGVLGGFTTFSSYSLQTLTLLQQGRLVAAASYAVGSMLLCLAACWAGWAIGRGLSSAGS